MSKNWNQKPYVDNQNGLYVHFLAMSHNGKATTDVVMDKISSSAQKLGSLEHSKTALKSLKFKTPPLDDPL